MILPLLLSIGTQSTTLSMSASYMTLGEIASALTKAGVSTKVAEPVSTRVYGICLKGASSRDVVQILKQDESLRIEEIGGGISINLSSDTNKIYQQERLAFIKVLQGSLTKIYTAANKTLVDIYSIRNPEARDTEEAQRLSGLPKPLSISDRLIFETSRYQDIPRYPTVRIPLLAIPILASSGSSQSQIDTLAHNIGYVSPLVESKNGPVPYTDSRSEGTFVGTLIGPEDESYADKLKRFQAIKTKVTTRWDPQDLRAACSFDVEAVGTTEDGHNYPGRYVISIFRTALANDESKDRDETDKILLPSHLSKVESYLAESDANLKGDSAFTAESTWNSGRSLLSDAILNCAKANSINVVFPISPYYNVAIDLTSKESLKSLLERSVSKKVFDVDAAARSKERLGVPRFDQNVGPACHPRWIVEHSGNVWGIVSNIRCFDSLSNAPILDTTLANKRLNGEPVKAADVLDAISARKQWASAFLPSSESLSWGNPTALLPFARLVQSSERVRKSLGMSKSVITLKPGEAKVLAAAMNEMDEIRAPQAEEVRGQVVAGRLLNEDSDRIALVMALRGKRQTFSITFNSESMWKAAVELP